MFLIEMSIIWPLSNIFSGNRLVENEVFLPIIFIVFFIIFALLLRGGKEDKKNIFWKSLILWTSCLILFSFIILFMSDFPVGSALPINEHSL